MDSIGVICKDLWLTYRLELLGFWTLPLIQCCKESAVVATC
jgi:hypothetical protein